MDLSAVNAARDKALSARELFRGARAAELYGRAADAALALQQPDCLVAAFLRCEQCTMCLVMQTVDMPDEEKFSMWKQAKTCRTVFLIRMNL